MYKEYDEFIDTLLSEMTLKEKIGQLNQIPEPRTEDEIVCYKEKIRNGEIGSIILASSATAGNDETQSIDVDKRNMLQRVAIEESTHHIPLLYGRDVIHGHRTVYPIALASACSFNPELVEQCYGNIAREASADSIHWTFSPMMDLCRDPRWGRIVEGPGEDPYLGAVMSASCVRGFQGKDFSDKERLIACAKHYIGYGASEGGRDYFRTEISDYSLQNYYLPAFRAAVDAGVGTVMSSFNDINGQPVTSSEKYLTHILREQLGFEGFVVSDWGAIVQLIKQGVAENREEASKLALRAGVDMDMCDNCYAESLEQLVLNGIISESLLDLSVRRILRIKLAKGLFESPYCDRQVVDRKRHLEDARKLAAESMVLLKNDGVLPLNKRCKIALWGPFADEKRSLFGTWTLDGVVSEITSFSEAIEQKVGRNQIQRYMDGREDVVVLALGEDWKLTGEAKSLADISLPSEQKDLIKLARAYGKKVIGVFFCGRPLALEDVEGDFDAILYAWHGGTETANAVCDILFGDTVPSGKTSVTFVRKTGHIPLYYNVTSSGRYVNGYYGEEEQKCYEDGVSRPLYPFGFGLSYTTFSYSKPLIDKERVLLNEIKDGTKIKVKVEVENTGDYAGKEVVQLYIHARKSTIMRPIRELKGFRKIEIKQGEKVYVEFELGYDELGYYQEDGAYVVEPGLYDIFVGENAHTSNQGNLWIYLPSRECE